jgi:predicted P-loop ATPase
MNVVHLPTPDVSAALPICLFGGAQAAAAGRVLGAGKWVALPCEGADMRALEGRRVFIWPNADPAGTKARDALLERLRGVAHDVWVIDVTDQADGWTAQDALESDGWNADHLEKWLKGYTVDGEQRLRQHAYPDLPARAGLLLPRGETPEPPTRLQPREAWELSSKTTNWANCEWATYLVPGAKTKSGNPTALRCIENAVQPLMYAPEWQGLFAWDELRQRITTTRATPWGEQPEEWLDHHDVNLECWYDRTGLHYKGLISQAVDLVAHRNAFHPVRDYLRRLKWDGEPRLREWLTTYCGAPNNDFTRFAGTKWMISAVARAMRPGCQVKTCLILFGAQDAGKSEAFRILGGPFYAVQHGSIGGDSTKAIEQCSKAWVLEMAELDKLKRTDNVEPIKAFISTYEDTYRPAYARRVQTLPRCCVFCGTSNTSEVFSDVTGNVRFWPVQVCDQIDLDLLRRDRDDLWAEAVALYAAGEKWWTEDEQAKSLAHQATLDYVVRDEWAVVILEWLDQPEVRLRSHHTTGEILSGALRLAVGDYGRPEQNRVGNCMRQIGFVNTMCAYSDDEIAQRPSDAPRQRRGWRRANGA